MLATQHYPSALGTVDQITADSEGYMKTDNGRHAGPRECPYCQNNFFMMDEQHIDRCACNEVLTNAQAKSILAGYISDILKSQKYLIELIERYGDRTLTRWRKVTQSKLTTLLRTTGPDLPLHKGSVI
jgi:hypothetical protein